ncbi:MAG: glutamate racemase [Oscillospiraceae bacterium]|jgi:glutamate racemase|nr:glutamate racemase [Oscillospiraceae bacterium]
MDDRAIGVFDSGVGGLTALRELTEQLPREHIIYLGDSYNMPYGEKTREEIVGLSRKNLGFLLRRGVKAVLVACGSATVNALDVLEKESPVPILGVVAPAVEEAARLTRNNCIGVLATRASIRTHAFRDAILERRGSFAVVSRACPVFATMVEYGIYDPEDERIRAAALEYLPPIRKAGADTIILGCTHYPLLSEVIKKYVGADNRLISGGQVRLVSSGAAAARQLARFIRENGLECARDNHRLEYFTTGQAEDFARSAGYMLQRDISGQLTAIDPL